MQREETNKQIFCAGAWYELVLLAECKKLVAVHKELVQIANVTIFTSFRTCHVTKVGDRSARESKKRFICL